jgi:hypothetical protein
MIDSLKPPRKIPTALNAGALVIGGFALGLSGLTAMSPLRAQQEWWECCGEQQCTAIYNWSCAAGAGCTGPGQHCCLTMTHYSQCC